MAPIHVKRCSTSVANREMKIKTTLRYHLILVRMAVINKSIEKCQQGCGERGTLLHYWWESRLVQPLWMAVWRYLKKLKMNLPFDSVIPLLGIYPQEPETLIQKSLSTPIFIAESFTITKLWKQPKCPSVDEWIEQLWDIYTMKYYLAVKKKQVLPFVTYGWTWTILCVKWNKPVRERQIPYDLIHMWNQMNKLNKETKLRQMPR